MDSERRGAQKGEVHQFPKNAKKKGGKQTSLKFEKEDTTLETRARLRKVGSCANKGRDKRLYLRKSKQTVPVRSQENNDRKD